MNERLTAIVGARITEFQRKMAEVKKMAKSLPNKIVVEVEARVDNFQKTMGRIANNIQSIGTVMANGFIGSLLAILPAIVPIIATLAGGLGAAVSAFGFAAAAAIAFGAVAIPTITKLFDETTKLTGAQKTAKGEFDKFQKTWKGITKDLEKPVLKAFTTAMQIANRTLQMARPLFDSAATAVNNLLNSLKQSLGTPPVQAFFDYMNKNAGPMLEKVGKSVGNFMQGFMSLMVAFGPLGEDFANGLLNMSTRFAEWSANLENNQAFQNFLTYVKENTPMVLDLIGNLTTFLVNLGIGLAPLGTKILGIVNSFLSWSNSMMVAHPWIAQIAGVLITLTGGLMALTPALVMGRVLFSGFGTTLMSVATKVGPVIMNFVKTVGAQILRLGTTFLVNATRIAASWVIAMGPIGWVIAAVVALVALIILNWDTVKSVTIETWSAVSKFISDAATKILGYIQDKFPALYKVIMSAMQNAQKIVTAVWDYIKSTFENVLSFLKALVKGDFEGMKDAISDQMNASQTLISTVWSAIKSYFGTVISEIVSTVKQKFSDIVNSVKEKMNDVKTKVQNGIDQVKSFLSGIDLSSMGKQMIQGLINGIGSMADELVRKAKGVVNGAIDAAKSLLKIKSPSRVFMGIGQYTGEGMVIGMNNMKSAVSKASTNMAKAAMIEPQRTQFAFDAGLSTSDFGRIRHDVGAEVSGFEMQDPTINVYNEWDGEKVVSYVERGNAKKSRITDGFYGK